MSNVAVEVDIFFKNHFLKILNGTLNQYNLNDISIWSLSWFEDKQEVKIDYSLHQDSLTGLDALECMRIENKNRPTPKEKDWMSKHHAKGHFILISVDSKKELEALKTFCHECKIVLKRYNRPKSYNINWW